VQRFPLITKRCCICS